MMSLVCISAMLLSADALHRDHHKNTVRQAVRIALAPLARGAMGHSENRACFACHSQALPLLAYSLAKSRGVSLPEFDIQGQTEHIIAFLDGNRENYKQGKGQGGQADTAGYALFALEVGGWEPDETTAAVVEYLLKFQPEKKHWPTGTRRPPSEASSFTTTYFAIRALEHWGIPSQEERIRKRIKEAQSWLELTPAKDNEDRAFRLLALAATKASLEKRQSAAWELLGKQNADGGWGQTDAMASDAYATGTALVALSQGGGLAADHPAYVRGASFLLQTQQADGTWHVVSRSKPFQAYFETGFPHGHDQFISSSASGWATAALLIGLAP